ncbi:MAG: hypothetical protein HG439_003925 [candidate division SR1 bacterium]|nr:hypothetical protein [candidate division SR1 bacterium]
MKKSVLCAMLTAVVSMGLASAEMPTFSLEATNLPHTFSGQMTLNLQAIGQNLPLSGMMTKLEYDLTGQNRPSDFQLFYQEQKKENQISQNLFHASEKVNFPIQVVYSGVDSSLINFSLKDEQNKTLANTTVALLPLKCGTPIDFDEDKILKEVAQNNKIVSQETPENLQSPLVSEKTNKKSFYKPLLPIYANWQWTPELKLSYEWAIQKGFFENNEINHQSFLKPMTRIELAQMIIALTEVTGQEPNIEKKCEFADLKGAPEATRVAAQLVCQFDIMGINQDVSPLKNFNPDEIVTRDQLTTVISRIIRREKYNQGGKTFYERHIEKLVEEGLLAGTAPNDKKITDTTPNLVEAKGIFYLLLQRAEKKNLITISNPVVEETTVIPTQTEEKSWRKVW